MRLIIDAGSTKMGWILMDGHEVKAHSVTKGFNPNYSPMQDLVEICHGASLSDGIRSIHSVATTRIAKPSRRSSKTDFPMPTSMSPMT